MENSNSIARGQISSTYRQEKTYHGYDFDIAKSALQKYIRRGRKKEALYFACELEMYRYFDDTKRLWTNFFNRVRIILLEDIGIYCPKFMIYAMKKIEQWKSYKGELFCPDLLILVNEMCKVYHTRYFSYLRKYIVVNNITDVNIDIDEDQVKKEIKEYLPNYFFTEDKRTIHDMLNIYKGIKEGNELIFTNIQSILNEKTKNKYFKSTISGNLILYFCVEYINKQNLYNPENRKIYKLIHWLTKWYKDLKVKENFLIPTSCVYLLLFRDYLNFEYTPETISRVNNENLRSFFFDVDYTYPLESYVIDIHTKRGKRSGKTKANFGVEGAFVVNEPMVYPNHRMMKNLYIQWNISQGEVRAEEDEIKWRYRSQLNTANNKLDVYYGTLKDTNKNVVVKGPYDTYEEVENIINIYSLVSLLKYGNALHPDIRYMIPSLEKPYRGDLGFRNILIKKNDKKPKFFILFRDIWSKKMPLKERSSKMWKPTMVPDYDAFFLQYNTYSFGKPTTLNEKQMKDFVIQYSIRYFLEIGDITYRNFIVNGKCTYNIDIDGIGLSNKTKFGKVEYDKIKDTLNNHLDYYQKVANIWINKDIFWNRIIILFNRDEEKVQEMKNNLRSFFKLENDY